VHRGLFKKGQKATGNDLFVGATPQGRQKGPLEGGKATGKQGLGTRTKKINLTKKNRRE